MLFGAGGGDVDRILLTVDVGVLVALEIDVALDPGAELVGVARNVVFDLARLDTTQAADAFCGIDTERPAMLSPVIARNGRWSGFCCSLGGCGGVLCDGTGRNRHGAARKGTSETSQKLAAVTFVLLALVLLVH